MCFQWLHYGDIIQGSLAVADKPHDAYFLSYKDHFNEQLTQVAAGKDASQRIIMSVSACGSTDRGSVTAIAEEVRH